MGYMIHPTKKEVVKRLVELTYASAFLKGEKVVSLILLAPPENSKTHFLLGFETRYSKVVTDLSYFGLIDLLEENKNIKHIVIPDFLKVTEKNQNTKKALIASLNAYLEEGIFDIKLANKEKKDLKGRKGGIITATTDASFRQNVKNWEGMGFKSRFIGVSWKYSDESMMEILEAISAEKNLKNKPKKLKFSVLEVKNNEKFKEKMIKLAQGSPRKLKNLQVLLKTIALTKGRKMPLKEDLDELEELCSMINFRFTEI